MKNLLFYKIANLKQIKGGGPGSMWEELWEPWINSLDEQQIKEINAMFGNAPDALKLYFFKFIAIGN